MIWHPLVLVILILDVSAFLLLLSAVPLFFQVILHWDPGQATTRQLDLEPRCEAATLQNLLGFGIYLFSSVLLFLGISQVFPDSIPGAMCGTGVVEALGESGRRILILRILGLTLYFLFYKYYQISKKFPCGEQQSITAKLMVLALPVLFLGLWETAQGFAAMNTVQPVDCCAAVLDLMNSSGATCWHVLFDLPVWLSSWGSVMVFAVILLTQLLPRKNAWLLILLTVLWSFTAYALLLRHLLPYHYGVLEHHCPWCAFKPEYRSVGFILFPLILWINWLVMGRAVDAHVLSKRESFPWSIIIYMLLFYTIAAGPALLWFLKSGTWIHG